MIEAGQAYLSPQRTCHFGLHRTRDSRPGHCSHMKTFRSQMQLLHLSHLPWASLYQQDTVNALNRNSNQRVRDVGPHARVMTSIEGIDRT